MNVNVSGINIPPHYRRKVPRRSKHRAHRGAESRSDGESASQARRSGEDSPGGTYPVCPVNGSDVLLAPHKWRGVVEWRRPNSSYQRQASRAPCTYQCVLTCVGRMWNIANGMKQPETQAACNARPCTHVHSRTSERVLALSRARTSTGILRTYTPRRGCAPAGV